MTAALYHRKMERALERMGGLYTLNDILERIADGRMQSHVEGNSWAVTQVSAWPRRRVLDVVVCVGDLEECRVLHDRILAYASELSVDLVAALGRRGWLKDGRARGWRVKTTSYLYHREM